MQTVEGRSHGARTAGGWASQGRSFAVGLAVSIAAHWIAARAVPVPRSETRRAIPRVAPAVSVTPGSERGPDRGLPREADVVTPGGSEARENVDSFRRGGGGDETGAYEVLFLVTESAPITLVDAPLNAEDRSQVQRLDTASDRASWDDRRATPHPDDAPFLASSTGEHRERRAPALVDARSGAREAPRASLAGDRSLGEGSSAGETANAADVRPLDEGSGTGESASRGTTLGAERASPGRGIVAGRGQRSDERARVATGRPSLDPGPVATVAEREGRVRDDTDAELLAAQLFESRADASRRAGEREGPGRGGAPGAPGEGSGGGRGAGGAAAPYGPGRGAFSALDTSDSRYRTWLLAQRRRIESRLAFPRSRQLARDQGTSVVRVVVRRDGTAADAPHVIRSSGFDDLDSAALLAVRSSLPFGPIPADLAAGQPEITVTLPIEFANPMVD